MGQSVSREDFMWIYTDEPHATRRKIILHKYPQIKKLFTHDPSLNWIGSLMVLFQVMMCLILKDAPWWVVIIAAYTVGGVINHSLTLVIHENSHGHNFSNKYRSSVFAKLFSMWVQLPIGVPMSISFKKYHLEHHRYMSDEVIDTDLPTAFEGRVFNTTFKKFIWLLLNPLFYALRPFCVNPKPVTIYEIINFAVQISFNYTMYCSFGPNSMFYLIGGTLLCLGVHPMAGHFISEHFMFYEGQLTTSYYGPLNILAFNVGYHNEHHDFPAVPFTKLHKVREIAPEFYNNLPHHTSWLKVVCEFVLNPNIGPFARAKIPKSFVDAKKHDNNVRYDEQIFYGVPDYELLQKAISGAI